MYDLMQSETRRTLSTDEIPLIFHDLCDIPSIQYLNTHSENNTLFGVRYGLHNLNISAYYDD
jgi:hypothetical protein